ncbi:Nuclear transport factor 2 (NTF2) family protein [Melia azedarach]|uniref:Nuclear transport factor 2 (NTF2) family protein n=2 Tax=Melia azedarach TaxID=155640 RepID=A0ACC1Y7E4_MELAZ|nr:Nuclear transport factor 2 (NTF2) family protein [Melia azedarach]
MHGVKCFSGTPDKTRTPQFLKFAVSGVTEFLRLFSSSVEDSFADQIGMRYEQREEISVSDIDDIVTILKADYENAYFVTGIFTSEIYVKDCIFEDPTISFRGTELYSRNLRLLVPFFEYPSIRLQKIEKGSNSKTNFVLATWKLRTYLKLPWRPLICIDGSTVYELNDEFKIIRHAENWNVSALEAIGQIFTPSN